MRDLSSQTKDQTHVLSIARQIGFQGKPFNIMVIQIYAPTSNAEEDEVEWFYENLPDFLEWTPLKRVQNTVLGCNLKNDRRISVHFQGKSFNITVIQIYAPTSNAEEAEVEWFYEDLQDLLELTLQKDVLFSL